jgi:pimeloyl-ACP methyl ester carboxylesterase
MKNLKYYKVFEKYLIDNKVHSEFFAYTRVGINPEQTVRCFCYVPHRVKALVIFAHGTGCDALYPQINLFTSLLEDGFAIFTFDLDGHGCYSTAILDRQNIFTAIADAASHIPQNLSHLNKHFVGYSLGASLVLNYAAKNSDSFASASLIACPVSAPKKLSCFYKEIIGFFSLLCSFALKTYTAWEIIPSFGGFKRKLYPIRCDNKQNFAYVNIVNEIIKLSLSDLNLEKIKNKILFLYGSNDKIATTNPKFLMQKINFKLFKHHTHLEMIFSEEVIKGVKKFINDKNI